MVTMVRIENVCFESKFDASCEKQINRVGHLYHYFVNGGVF